MGSRRAPGQNRAAFIYDPDGEDEVDPRVGEAERRFLSLDGVEGVGLGVDPSGNQALLVYIRSATVAANLPRHFRGLPVVARTTGEIRPY